MSQLASQFTVPVPFEQSVMEDATACALLARAGPSDRADGFRQLKPASVEGAEGETVGETFFVGLGLGESVPVTVGVGVSPGASTVKSSVALRCVTASLATIVCFPGDQDDLTLIETVKVPSPPTWMVP